MPPSFISMVMPLAPASMAFSTNSFTTAAGRSTTSPAAILLMVLWSNKAILDMKSLLNYRSFFPFSRIGIFAYHLSFTFFCNLYNSFMASIGVMTDKSISRSLKIMSSEELVLLVESKIDI